MTAPHRDPAPAPYGPEGPESEVIVRTADLTKVYPETDFAAVDRINLRVRRGEIFGLLGPNGAGKTTTVGMLTGRVVPTGGAAFIGGIDVVRQPTRVKQIIAAVTQQNTLDRSLTVWENLYFHGLLFGIPRRQSQRTATELLEEFHLTRWRASSVQALSGGMAQRLMLARAIFHRPAVLFLDEPTAGLDPQGRLDLWGVLERLIADGQTILLTTHNMEEADRLCDRVAIIDHGRVLALDTPSALKRGLGADTTVTVIANGPAQKLADQLRHDIPRVVRTRFIDGGVELQVKGNDRLLPKVVASAENSGFELIDLSLSESTLETVFISLTGKELRD
ncbi:ATP-binding cassette domain-containing protein [Streptomyces albipurpureus]|uniref:ATP-binding cassette domain-containing protein n=1 Tax=Streptomyces albipurpureus TaxID=2897419 RepID=A0ABT0V1T3_9ACTN|nr:ATP-binding cassette domain-containing protein [Streptomyces sp. CWNU-1]MCM2393835.1 ATP-binding cassette domain-containing protein [Streptomyces sp. CWNU-1]